MQPSQAAVFSGRCDLVVPSSLCKEAAVSRSWHLLRVSVLQQCVQSLSINRQTSASPREWGLEGLSRMFLS